MSAQRMRIAGVDGCRRGWVVVDAESDIANARIAVVANWHEVLKRAQLIAVDMPIGLSTSGSRDCETHARAMLRLHGARVFRTPPRGSLEFAHEHWAEANAWSKRQGFGGISKQTWNICPKIREIDAIMQPRHEKKIFEAHPELAFRRLHGMPVASKHTREGSDLRLKILRDAGFRELENWIAAMKPLGAKADDVLDACALVLTAQRIADGRAQSLPPAPQRDERGLRMAIWV